MSGLVHEASVELDPDEVCASLIARHDLPAAVGEAAASVDREDARRTIRDGLSHRAGPSLATALLVSDAALGLPSGWEPLHERLAMSGGLFDNDLLALHTIRVARRSETEPSTYLARRGNEGVVGIAVRLRFTEGSSVAEAWVALAGVSAAPLRARQVEASLRGRTLSRWPIPRSTKHSRLELAF